MKMKHLFSPHASLFVSVKECVVPYVCIDFTFSVFSTFEKHIRPSHSHLLQFPARNMTEAYRNLDINKLPLSKEEKRQHEHTQDKSRELENMSAAFLTRGVVGASTTVSSVGRLTATATCLTAAPGTYIE